MYYSITLGTGKHKRVLILIVQDISKSLSFSYTQNKHVHILKISKFLEVPTSVERFGFQIKNEPLGLIELHCGSMKPHQTVDQTDPQPEN